MDQTKIAIVTGAGSGVGKGIARRFAREGMTVVVAELNRENGEAVAEELGALGGAGVFIPTDITELQSVGDMVASTLQQFGHVDILVNNAYPTGQPFYSAADMPEERYAKMMTAGFHAVVTAMRAVYPSMSARKWGRIINICSLNGVNAHPMTADYNSAKEAVRAFTRTCAVEWGKDGITANIVCPSAATEAFKRRQAEAPEMIASIMKMVPMGYSGDPEEDIAPVVAFLASEGARYLTGNTLFADGGGHINGVPWKP